MREHDITVGCENIFAELMDLAASGAVRQPIDGFAVVEHLRDRYDALWRELTDVEEFRADEIWRIEQRVERLNDLGFDVDELDIVTDLDGDTVRIQPKVVELGHHRRELQALTGMTVEDNQARRLLNDMASYTAHYDLGREDRHLVASRWMHEIYEPIMAMVPPDASGKLEPPEVFHEILVHRWYLSEAAGREVDIFETAPPVVPLVNVYPTEPSSAVTASGPSVMWVCPPTTRSAQPRRRTSRPRLASWTSTRLTGRPSSSRWSHAASATRSATSVKLSPLSSRQFPRPLDRGSSTPSSAPPQGASTTSPSSIVHPRSSR
jgi:hypothetical protein